MSLKVPVIRLQGATVYLEEWEGYTFGHCDVHRWTPGVAKQLQKSWKTLLDLHGGPIYATHEPGDSKHLKWCLLFGFKFFTKIQCTDGKTREVYVCEAKET